MPAAPKIVLHSLRGYRPELEVLVAEWVRQGVKYVGVVGVDAARIEDAIDDLCVGDGSSPYFMLTASHEDESLDDAVFLAEQLSGSLLVLPLLLSSNHGLARVRFWQRILTRLATFDPKQTGQRYATGWAQVL